MLKNLINQGFLVDSKNISFLHHPRDYKEQLLSLISSSKKRILFNCLYLENDESGQEIMQALKDAVLANPQLTVDICLDLHRAQRNRLGENKSSNNALWYLESLQGFNQEMVNQHQLSRPPIKIVGIPANGRELFGVYHIKGYVFDDTVLYTGASINNNYCAYSTYRLDRYQLITDKALADSFYDFTVKNFLNLDAKDKNHATKDACKVTSKDTNADVNTDANAEVNADVHADTNSDVNSKTVTDEEAQDLAKRIEEDTDKIVSKISATPVEFSATKAPERNSYTRLSYKAYRQNFLLNKELQYSFGPKVNLEDLPEDKVLITPIYGAGKNNPINLTIFRAISLASESITIYTPYFNFTKTLTKRIIDCCRRGIKVKIIVSDKVANDFYASPELPSYTSANALPYLYEMNLYKFIATHQQYIDNGSLEVYSWKDEGNSYHAKGLIIDSKIYIFTGSNLNLRSFNVDVENALLCYDPHQNLKDLNDKEYAFVKQHLTLLDSTKKIESKTAYPERVRKTLKRASLFFIDRLAKRLF